jgi:uncharacterized protein (DUF1330 family)
MTYKLPLTLAAGLALGAGAVGALHAQAKPPVYVINEIEVTDPAGFKTYADRMGALVTSMGGKFIVRGGKTETLDGATPGRVTVYVFDSMEKMQAWHDSPAAKELKAIRDKASKFRAFAVEGRSN